MRHFTPLINKDYPDAIDSLPSSAWDIMEKFWALDLSEADTILRDRYSDFGPAPRLPSFPFLSPASRHDSHGFLYSWFSMKQFLPDAAVKKLILDSAHDAMPYYEYCHDNGITPFIGLNGKGGRPPVYKDDFTSNDKGGVPVCCERHTIRRDGTESAKGRTKFKCPKISFAGGSITSTCRNPCPRCKVWQDRSSCYER